MRAALLQLILITVTILITGCGQNKSATGIEDNLNKIITNKQYMVSSNPNDYIKNQLSAYKEILGMGDEALAYLTKELRTSDQDGLREWVMAKACEDILKDHSSVKEWATGKEWIKKYDESK
ncbi:hypothetical protein FE783_15730 [Paenibacillus mesophilus]|uniref:hypothetical protein n=1 Tax=Paenibacillus mesophilus TaxID=2582849 RepID=UPI00110D67E2|nr:hypothetical protein [Paenibacillus mesophilus]TMV49116.1 hypothetical protein FE783_15730 [Paenibacillus mesophilus]